MKKFYLERRKRLKWWNDLLGLLVQNLRRPHIKLILASCLFWLFMQSTAVHAQVQIGDAIYGSGYQRYFGVDISMNQDGSIMAVGAQALVKVYENQAGSWVQIGADLDASQASGGTGVTSLSSDGTIVAVGAPRYDHLAQVGNGKVTVYQYTSESNTWTQIGQTLTGASGSWFGNSVSLSDDGTIMAVGNTLADVNGSNSGQAAVYENQSGTWVQIGQTLYGIGEQDRFGNQVSISSDGSKVAISGNNNTETTTTNSGYVKIFENQSGTWTQLGATLEGEAEGDYSGGRISLSSTGAKIAIGSTANDGNGDASGHVRVYQYSKSGVWEQLGSDIDGEAAGDYAGTVSMSDDGLRLAIGALQNDDGANQAGHARIFEYQIDTWVQVGQDIDGENEFDFSGTLGLSGDGEVLGFGSYRYDTGTELEDTDAGRVLVFGGLDNQPPTVANPLADVVITEGFSTESISLTDVFSDPNGDALSFTATSSNTSVATISSAEPFTLVVAEGTALGSTEITVTADDGDLGVVTNSFTLTVEEADVTAPTFITLSPADGAIDVVRDGVYVITFDEEVVKQSGFIRFFNAAGTLRKTVSMAAATIDGNTMTIDPSQTFSYGEELNIRIDAGAVADLSGNDFAGITNATTWNFTTINAPEVSLNSTSIDENEPSGTVVGILSTINAEEGESYTYNLVSGTGDTDNGSFTVNGDELRSNEVFDFEVKPTYSVRIYTFDGSQSFARSFSISINDVSESIIWNGSAWSNGTGPTASDDVIIDGNYSLDNDGVFAVNNLTVNPGFTLNIDGENTITINGDIVNKGDMIVESGASLITFSTTSIGWNELQIKRNTRYTDGKYSFVGTPVEQTSAVTDATIGSNVYYYDETEPYSSNDGLDRWDEMAGELVPGRGYTQAFQQEMVFVGYPNAGTITYSGTYTEDTDDANEGWHLVSNPYPAAIFIDDFLDANMNTTDAIYIWDDNGSDTGRGSSSDYIVANKTEAIDLSGPNNESRWNGHIGSAQGFFVKLDGAPGNITFTEGMRVSGNNTDGNFFRVAKSERPIVRLNLTHVEGLKRQAVIGWNENISNTELAEGYDAKVFSKTSDYMIYTVKANAPLAIQTVNRDIQEIPVGFNVAESGQYTLEFMLENIDTDLYLYDKEADQEVSLSGGSYSFYSAAGQITNRFELRATSKVLALEDEKVNIYAHNKVLHIETARSKSSQYQLFDLSGVSVLKAFVNGSTQINLNHLSNGVYIVSDGIETKKIILQ